MAMPIRTINLTTDWVRADSGVAGQDILLLPSVDIYIANVTGADADHRGLWPSGTPWGVNELGGTDAGEAVWIRTVSGSGDVVVCERGVNIHG